MATKRSTTVTVNTEVKDKGSAELKRIGDKFGQTLGEIEKNTRNTKTVFTELNQSFSVAMRGAHALSSALSNTVGRFVSYEKQLALISTIVDTTSTDMVGLKQTISAMSSEFGTKQTTQAKAFYETIAAGVTDVSAATEVMRQANILSVGGNADLQKSIDGLTSILNAYRLSQEDLARVSDIFFVSAREGKTTVEELAEGIGTVVGSAALAKVPIEEMFAAVTTLTKVGISTEEAVVAVNQALNNIIDPSEKARKEMKQLGIEVDFASLKKEGFAKTLDKITSNSKFTTDSLALLFGNIRSQKAVFTLANNDGELFAQTLGAMSRDAGVADAAYARMTDTMAKRLDKVIADLDRVGAAIGEVAANATDANGKLDATHKFLQDIALLIERDAFKDFFKIETPFLDKLNEWARNEAPFTFQMLDTLSGSMKSVATNDLFGSIVTSAKQAADEIREVDEAVRQMTKHSPKFKYTPVGQKTQDEIEEERRAARKREEEREAAAKKAKEAHKQLLKDIEEAERNSQEEITRGLAAEVEEREQLIELYTEHAQAIQDLAFLEQERITSREETEATNLANQAAGFQLFVDQQGNLVDLTNQNFAGLSDSAAQVGVSIASSFTDAFAQATVNAQNFGQLFTNVIKTLAAQLISSGLLGLISMIGGGPFLFAGGLLTSLFGGGKSQGTMVPLPHFAGGGRMVGGVDVGRDTRLAAVRSEEEILTPAQSRTVRAMLSEPPKSSSRGSIEIKLSGPSASSAETQRWLIDEVIPNLRELLELGIKV